MNTEIDKCVSQLPLLSDEDVGDAAFRANDRAWAQLHKLYAERAAVDKGISYAALGRRIGKTRGQVGRWMSSSANMTLASLGLLAEALDADLHILLEPRQLILPLTNYAHPSDIARDSQLDSRRLINPRDEASGQGSWRVQASPNPFRTAAVESALNTISSEKRLAYNIIN